MGNVLINGRTAVHAGSGGTLTTVDVCLTKVGKPVVPIPYTNIAKSSDAAKTAGSVMINGNPVCTKSSIFSKSTGDEPGDHKGISSGTIQGKAEFITASPNVMIEGVPAARQGDMMVSNNKNTAPMPLAQGGASKPPKLDVEGAEEMAPTEEPFEIQIDMPGLTTHMLKPLLNNSEDA